MSQPSTKIRLNPFHELTIAHALVVENNPRKAQKLRERYDRLAALPKVKL